MKRINTTHYGPADIQECTYHEGGRLCIWLMMPDGERLATLTVNMPEVALAAGEFLVKTWSENEQIAADALASGLFVDTGKRVPAGYCEAQIWTWA